VPDSPIFVKTYDLIAWLVPRTLKFPREHRLGLAARLQTCVYDLQRALLAAVKAVGTTARAEALRQADIALSELRLLLRLAADLNVLERRGYEHAARLTEEVGKLLGAWQKKCGTTG
jgi:hypothetical protein